MFCKRRVGWPCAVLVATAVAQVTAHSGEDQGLAEAEAFAHACTPAILQAAADRSEATMIIEEISNIMSGQEISEGTRFFAATDSLPAFCQVSGSFVTDAETGKTANFLATLPENWNGKYLQYGCFGTCGFFLFNDASSPHVDNVAQGLPGDSLRKGYASFSTDEGHQTHETVSWAEKGPGKVDREAIDDYLHRAMAVLAPAAKRFTSTFYSHLSGTSRNIEKSYFTGCSGGGRNALVAASHFPEEFDGFIAGSPAMDLVGMSFHSAAFALATRRPGYTDLSPTQVTLLNTFVDGKCDDLDGVKDGLIQNPAACDFTPERDLPLCDGSEPGAECFTQAQVDALSVLVTSVVDEQDNLVYPGLAISNLAMAREKMVSEGERAEGLLRVLMFGNPADFSLESVIRLTPSESGVSLRAVVDSARVAEAREAMGKGVVDTPKELDAAIEQNRKLMIWHDLSDNTLTPYETINYYTQLAERHGDYESLQENVRLFALPGTSHCSGGFGGVGPNSFDALTALERWVEKGEAPNNLVATHYPGTEYSKDTKQPPGRTMPLCQFPQSARYQGEGDIDDAANWHCPSGDEAMLKMGESGRRAGVME